MTTATISLNGSVQSQGIKLDVRDWLDMGSPTWMETREQDKALAYQASICHGWTEAGLLKVIADNWGDRIDETMARETLDYLKEIAQRHPAQVEELPRPEAKPPVFKVRGVDKTFPFPSE